MFSVTPQPDRASSAIRNPKSEIWGWRVALVAFIAARVALSLWAWLVLQINPLIVGNLDLFGEKVVVAFDLQAGQRAAFSRVLDNRELHFRAAPPNFVDEETNSVWDLRGRALSGARAGAQLGASSRSVEEIFPYHGVAVETNPLLAPWQRFDTNWYLAIAQYGYANSQDIHFPPLYPALIRIIATVLGNNYLLSAWLISNLALIAALVLLYRQTLVIASTFASLSVNSAKQSPTSNVQPPTSTTEIASSQSALLAMTGATAARTIAYLVLFPTAFFLFAPYTESLFLLFSLLVFDALARERWHWAGVWAFLGVLTRLQGIALIVPIAWAIGNRVASRRNQSAPIDLQPTQVGFAVSWRDLNRPIALGLPLAALALYLAMRAALAPSGAIPTSEPDLHAHLAPPWENFLYALQTIASGKFLIADVMNLLVTILCGVALVVGWRKLPRAYSLYTAASLIVLTMRVVDTQPLNSMVRYALTLFPVFMVLGDAGTNAWVNRVVVYISFALALFLSGQFVMWGWVG